ncbi:MAG: sensor histidine kinase [Spirosomataceae bacterium]
MAKNQVFFNLYGQLSGWRIVLIVLLLAMGGFVLYYFREIGQSLEDRETKYAKLYAESIRFFMEKELESDCDYTFVQEVLMANETVPSILVLDGYPSSYANIPELDDSTLNENQKERLLYAKISEMNEEHPPLSFNLEGSVGYVYYSNSSIVRQLRYFPYILLVTFLIFGSLAYIAYSSARKAEQNRVWIGLAKETAHQLGTPISALMAWVEVLRSSPDFDQSIGDEIEKDIHRLDTITTRFSNIGSVPQLKQEVIFPVLDNAIRYLGKRLSTKVIITVHNLLRDSDRTTELNKPLFEWVIENLCKNAVDAMAGVGKLDIFISTNSRNKIVIDFKDTGKGISKLNVRKVFQPGFSTKKRGWGLGLTLAKRIIETYHGGQLFVYETEIDKGTTFRIILP